MLGKVVSKGISIGRIKIIMPYGSVGILKTDNTQVELQKLEKSYEKSLNDLTLIIEKAISNIGENEAMIFEAHKMILTDPTLKVQIEKKIIDDNIQAVSAIEYVMNEMAEMFKNMDSDYMKERAIDMIDIKKRWIKNTLNKSIAKESISKDKLILVSEELTPSETLEMDLSLIGGILMEKGGVTSHTAILAQAMDIPAIVGCGPIIDTFETGMMVILDADNNTIIRNPSLELIETYKEKIKALELKKNELKALIGKSSETKDGVSVELGANIAGPDDMDVVLSNDAEAIGLFRTEFIYMNKSKPPTLDEQFNIYKTILERMEGKSVIFRTMDIGGDKEISYFNIPKEHNPFLGYRAIRYCLKEPDIFKTQIKSILMASVYGKAKIMFPMISSIKEFLDAKKIIEEVKSEMYGEGLLYDENIPIGIMVEIPSAAIQAKQFAKYVDFFSIGTNDLTQYTLAVDRQNELIGELYDYYHPAVLSLIHHVIKIGKETNTWVGMCGSAAGDVNMIPLLVSWGISELSMPATQVLKARQCIRKMNISEINSLAMEVLEADNALEVRQMLKI